jgi:hypothetical protein
LGWTLFSNPKCKEHTNNMRVTSKTRPHLINTNKTQQNNKKNFKKKEKPTTNFSP